MTVFDQPNLVVRENAARTFSAYRFDLGRRCLRRIVYQ